ncbi:unnamed protein product [Danaus chrysippus]|uniref:(African queen) hypothetical protein n=1 Tax=Danaus chrysippus TaxID=151541 RepID=A0A8J2R683_9NEOP|nr:unnamed protein product [Danaus chrysippus]
MVEEKQARYVVSAWEPALEMIFRYHPSAKFAYTGRLDINDFTQEGFYVQKRLGSSFHTLKQLADSRDPIYTVMFMPGGDNEPLDIRTPYQPSESRLTMTASSKLRFSVFPDDSNLRSYLLRLRIWFGDPYREKCEEVSTSLKARAQLLGEFVAEQMSGLNQDRDCSMPSVNLHIADIMTELKSCIIGLGFIRCGGPLERAVLYKVLADRVGLPCALYRGSSAHAWCEVAVPEMDPNGPMDKDERFPAGLLRANYVVDLMERPGRLLPLSSPEAKNVCGAKCTPYTARVLDPVCKCEH